VKNQIKKKNKKHPIPDNNAVTITSRGIPKNAETTAIAHTRSTTSGMKKYLRSEKIITKQHEAITSA
jgi:hypothetical protein